MKYLYLIITFLIFSLPNIAQNKYSNRKIKKIIRTISNNDNNFTSPCFIITLNPGECINCKPFILSNIKYLKNNNYKFYIVTPIEVESIAWTQLNMIFKIDSSLIETNHMIASNKLYNLLQQNRGKSRLFFFYNKNITYDDVFFTTNESTIDSLSQIYFINKISENKLPILNNKMPVNNISYLNNHLIIHNLIAKDLSSIDLIEKTVYNLETENDILNDYLYHILDSDVSSIQSIIKNIRSLDSMNIKPITVYSYYSDKSSIYAYLRLKIPYFHLQKDSISTEFIFVKANAKLQIIKYYYVPKHMISNSNTEYTIMYYGSPFSKPFIIVQDAIIQQIYRPDRLDFNNILPNEEYLTTMKLSFENDSIIKNKFINNISLPKHFIDSKKFYYNNWLNYFSLNNSIFLNYINSNICINIDNGKILNFDLSSIPEFEGNFKQFAISKTKHDDIAIVRKYDDKYFLIIVDGKTGHLIKSIGLPDFINASWILTDSQIICFETPMIRSNRIIIFNYTM